MSRLDKGTVCGETSHHGLSSWDDDLGFLECDLPHLRFRSLSGVHAHVCICGCVCARVQISSNMFVLCECACFFGA